MTAPMMNSLLLGSSDPDRLREWYVQTLGAVPDPDGFLVFGQVAVLIDGRGDVAAQAANLVMPAGDR